MKKKTLTTIILIVALAMVAAVGVFYFFALMVNRVVSPFPNTTTHKSI